MNSLTVSSSTIYVLNFPEDWFDVDVRELLGKFGVVKDVFIPTKRNIGGKRFAFVRFDRKENVEEILGGVKGL